MPTQADPASGTHAVILDERVKKQKPLQRLLIRPEMGALFGAIAIFVFFPGTEIPRLSPHSRGTAASPGTEPSAARSCNDDVIAASPYRRSRP